MRSLYTDERGVSPVVATLLLISLFIGVYAIYMNVTIPSEFATKEKEHMSEVRDSFLRLQSAVQEMSAGESRSISVPMSANLVSGTVRGPGIGGRLVVIENESLYYEIQNAYYSPQTYIYENGAVILYQPRENKSIMVSPPTMVSVVPYGDNVKVTIRSVRLMSSGEVTGTGTETLAVSIITSETSGGNPNGVSGMPGDPTVNIYPSDDAWTDEYASTTNYNDDWLHVEEDANGWAERTYIKFNLENIPDTATVDSATLYLYTSGYSEHGTEDTVVACEVDDDTWSESTITWNDQPDNGSVIDSTEVNSDHAWFPWTVTDWINSQNGGDDNASMALRRVDDQDIDYKCFHSKEQGTNSPYLEVTYTEAAAPPGKPVLVSPENNDQTPDNTPTFTWTAGSGATSHRLVIDDDPNFADGENIYDNANLGGSATSCTIENELPYDNYYWKVIAVNAQGENESENVWTFEVVEELVEELLEKVTIVIQSNYPDAWRDYLVGLVEQLRDDGIYATIDLQNLQLTVHGESTDPGVKDIYVVRESKDISIAIS